MERCTNLRMTMENKSQAVKAAELIAEIAAKRTPEFPNELKDFLECVEVKKNAVRKFGRNRLDFLKFSCFRKIFLPLSGACSLDLSRSESLPLLICDANFERSGPGLLPREARPCIVAHIMKRNSSIERKKPAADIRRFL